MKIIKIIIINNSRINVSYRYVIKKKKLFV